MWYAGMLSYQSYRPTRWFLLLLQNLRLVPLAYLQPFILRQVARPNLLHGDAFLRRAYAFRLYTLSVRARVRERV